MTAEEIRNEVKRNCTRWEVATADLIPLATYGMVAEIAAQLAELNAQLNNLVSHGRLKVSSL